MTLTELNKLDKQQLKEVLARCCGSTAWVEHMTAAFPFNEEESLFKEAATIWHACAEIDWREAFSHHPKIGGIDAVQKKFAVTSAWAAAEQSGVQQADFLTIEALAEGNKLYEEKFGYIFIVCATGKSAHEMLALLKGRLNHTPENEIHIAMEEQNKITLLRLKKLLQS